MAMFGTMRKQLIILSVPGRPVPKGRPRFAAGHVYTPERTRNAEEIMRAEMRRVCTTPLRGPVELAVWFSFKRPESWPKTRRDAVDDNGDEPWYSGKPELDNLVKLVQDAANRILWLDDAQVVKLEAYKVYGADSETVINVMVLEED